MAKRGGFPGGGMPGNMANLMKQAQRMQRQMEEQQKELEAKEFTAAAGGGAVEVTVTRLSDGMKITPITPAQREAKYQQALKDQREGNLATAFN